MKRPRVILADDHTLILDALKNLLEPEFEVVGMFAEGAFTDGRRASLRPNVIVLDIGMPNDERLKRRTTAQTGNAAGQARLPDDEPRS